MPFIRCLHSSRAPFLPLPDHARRNSSALMDLVWVDSYLCLASQPYLWPCQYMADVRPDVLIRLLYDQPRPRLKSQTTYKDAGIERLLEKLATRKSSRGSPAAALAGEASNNEVKLERHSTGLIRPTWAGCRLRRRPRVAAVRLQRCPPGAFGPARPCVCVHTLAGACAARSLSRAVCTSIRARALACMCARVCAR